jgi:beta-lactam-binding protein with PASTA domain
MGIARLDASRLLPVNDSRGLLLLLVAIAGTCAGRSARAQAAAGALRTSATSQAHAVMATIEVVDWNTGTIRLAVPLVARGPLRWKTQPPTVRIASPPTIKARGNEIVIEGRMRAIAGMFTPGARSLWIENGADPCRIDLPAVELRDYRHVSSEQAGETSADEGVQCSWTARHLLPGFTVWLTRQGVSDARPLSAVPLSFGHGAFGFIRQVRPHADGWEICLVFPQVTDESLKSRYSFTLVNPDGSRSRTMAILRHGNTLVGGVEEVAPPHPAPVDEPVHVPRVALHTLAEAVALAEHAHLVPTLIALQSGQTLQAKDVKPGAFVLRQVPAPGEVVLRGAALRLTVNTAVHVSGSDDSTEAKLARPVTTDFGQEKEETILKLPQGPATVVESSRPNKVRVPALAGKTERAATALLAEVGLLVVTDDTRRADDLVASSEPAAQAWVAPATVVRLKKLVTLTPTALRQRMPSLFNQTLAVAKKTVAPLGLRLEEPSTAGNRYATRPTRQKALVGELVVERQSVPAGHEVERNAVVSLTLVRLVAPSDLVQVPRLLGDTLAQAEELAHHYGLAVQTRPGARAEARETDKPGLAGKTVVDNQTPVAGGQITKGGHIEVVMVHYRDSGVLVPNVKGLTVLVPPFAGRSLEEASRLAHELGLTIRPLATARIVRRPTDNPAQIGKTVVDWQSVPEHTAVEKNAVVELRLVEYIDAGVSVPNFHGMTPEAATLEARRASLVLHESIVTVVAPLPALVGRSIIENQSYMPRTRVPVGTKIDITVAKYTPRQTVAKVPSFHNLTFDEASRLAAQSGVVTNVPATRPIQWRPTDNPALIGKVVLQNQSIVPGQTVNKGAVVENDLVGYHPPGITVPKLLGMTIEEARAQAQALGIAVYVRPTSGQRTRWAAFGERPGTYVENQSTPTGTIVPRGTRIEITLVRFVLPRTSLPRR